MLKKDQFYCVHTRCVSVKKCVCNVTVANWRASWHGAKRARKNWRASWHAAKSGRMRVHNNFFRQKGRFLAAFKVAMGWVVVVASVHVCKSGCRASA